MATISATDQVKLRDGFAPLLEGFTVVEFDNLEAARVAVGPNTAGFLVEPIQGEGGIRPASPEFMRGLRALCDEHDLMLVLDEVQCGVGRCGAFTAAEAYGVVPDAVTLAKGLGSGLPIAATIVGPFLSEGVATGDLGSTFGGGPVPCAAAIATLDAIVPAE